MTAGEAIKRAQALRPAAMQEDPAMYYRWLTEVEQEVIEHLNRHADPSGETPDDEDWQAEITYTETDADSDLLLPDRYEMVYVYKLMCEIDMMCGETDRSNNDATLYNQMMGEWKAWYRRGNRPKAAARSRWKLV